MRATATTAVAGSSCAQRGGRDERMWCQLGVGVSKLGGDREGIFALAVALGVTTGSR